MVKNQKNKKFPALRQCPCKASRFLTLQAAPYHTIPFLSMSVNQGGSVAGRSFHDYHLIVEEEEEANGAANSPLLLEHLTSPPPSRRHVYNAGGEVFFDEDTTLTSREEPSQTNLDLFSSPLRQARTPRPSLGRKNYLNVLVYFLHLFVSWGIGIWGLDGTINTRWQITTKYETLVTPAAWAYHLWAPILVLEAILSAAQLLPYYRSRPIIQDGIGYFFLYTFILQTAWTIFFSFELFVCSFVSCVGSLVSLISLLLSQLHACSSTDLRKSWLEYLLFRFPFFLHCGWMALMTVNHFSMLFTAFGTSASLQVSIDVLSLALMLAFGVICLVRPPYQDFVIPCVLIWSFVSVISCLTVA